MAKGKSIPFLVRVHNATCPAWLLNIASLKKIEPGCRLASSYEG
jgi:hypothetical protein